MRKMMNKDAILPKIVLLLLSVFAALMCGCEDKIQVDLKNTEPRLVIEGIMIYPIGATFTIRRSTDFYQPNQLAGVSGALIVISDGTGRVDTVFEEVRSPGFYWNDNIRSDSLATYLATVTVGGKTYEASTTMPLPKNIDSVRMSFQEGGGFGPEEDSGYRVHVFFRDRKGVPDYARIKLWKNNVFWLDYYLYDGKFSDGNAIDYDDLFTVYQIDDTLEVELVSMNKKMYDYFVTLSEVVADKEGGSSFDATPANPNTNWSGGALGYFGAFYRDGKRFVVRK